MAYITNQDIALRIGPAAYVQLTDDTGTGSADEAVVTAARLAAEGEVDSYLARRHRVPVDVTEHAELEPILASAALDVAAYRLYARRPPVPEAILVRYRSALAWLGQVAAGEVVLPAERLMATNDATGLHAATAGDAAMLSRRSLEGL